MGHEFPRAKEVKTGSWLSQDFQGRGYGAEMRAAVLELAFHGLGAEAALSSSLDGVEASLRISQKLGYVEDGESWLEVRGQRRLDRHAAADTRPLDRPGANLRADQRARAVLPAIWVERSTRALGSGLLTR